MSEVEREEDGCIYICNHSRLSALLTSFDDPVSKCNAIQDLIFSDVLIDTPTSQKLVQGLQVLQRLTFMRTILSPGVVAMISSFHSSTTLQVLNLLDLHSDTPHNPKVNSGFILSMLERNASLKECRIGFRGGANLNWSAAVDAVCCHPTLERLELILESSVAEEDMPAMAISRLVERNAVLQAIRILHCLSGAVEEIEMIGKALMRNQTLRIFELRGVRTKESEREQFDRMRVKVLQSNLTLTTFPCLQICHWIHEEEGANEVANQLLCRNEKIADYFVPGNISDGILPFLLARSSRGRISELHFFLCSLIDLVAGSLSDRRLR